MAVDIYQPNAQDTLNLEELGLYHQIMRYRAAEGLDPVRLSASLTLTAGRHVVDTRENIWGEDLDLPDGANLHSWSDAPYMEDGSAPEVMWEAPERLGTDYPGNGYEITGAGYETSAAALEGWQNSPSHDQIILNEGPWAPLEWNAIGVGLDRSSGAGPYAGRVYHVWFGTESDPAGPPEIVGTSGDDDVEVTDFADILNAGDGDDTIDGGRGNDRLSGQDGDDRLIGGRGDDRLSGAAGEDVLFGRAGNDTLLGGSGEDLLNGGSAADRLSGGQGADRLAGATGRDTLDGGGGRDMLAGGDGADVFVFGSLSDSPANPAGRDVIEDFRPGLDRIDLSGIASDLDFIGRGSFTDTPGEIRNAFGVLSLDANGDGRADLQVEVGTNAVSQSDLIL